MRSGVDLDWGGSDRYRTNGVSAYLGVNSVALGLDRE
jgi:hypothetical protein